MKSFLIVEDDEATSRLCELLIKDRHSDALVSHASNGKEALEKIALLDYTVIITDFNMPIMNGLEFFKRLKECKPHLAKRTALMSAYIDTSKTSYFLQEGCQHLIKPYRKKEFYGVIDHVLDAETERFMQEHGYECMRKNARFGSNEKCTIRPMNSTPSASKPTIAETIDYSEDGLRIKYEGRYIPLGSEILVTVSPLNIIKKRGKLVWSKPLDGCFTTGLQWI